MKALTYNKIALGKKIANNRILNNLTQEQLANKLGLSKGYISALECGKKSPTLETLINIADLFKVTPDNLLIDSLNKYYDNKIHSENKIINAILEEISLFSEDNLIFFTQITKVFEEVENKKKDKERLH